VVLVGKVLVAAAAETHGQSGRWHCKLHA
jgi:hypothetical protein